jgi:hypothetical protein
LFRNTHSSQIVRNMVPFKHELGGIEPKLKNSIHR